MEISTRAVYRGQITKLVNATEIALQKCTVNHESDIDFLINCEEELNVLLDRVKAAYESLEKANASVKNIIKVDDFEKEAESIAEYNDKAVTTISYINQRLKTIKLYQEKINPTLAPIMSSIPPPAPKSSTLHLSKLQLRKFSGNFKEWIPFWEQFRSLVHENCALAPIDKFIYLETALTGKAAETIAGFTPSDASYSSAINLLKEEYGNTEKLIDHIMQQLLAIPYIQNKSDANSLRHLYNTVKSATRSLEHLGVPTSTYFVMLKGVLLRVLPKELRIDFHKYCGDYLQVDGNKADDNEDDGASVKTFSSSSAQINDKQVNFLLKFLKREVESLEKAVEAKTNTSNETTVRRKPPRTAVGLHVGISDNCCFICNSCDHETKECDSTTSVIEKKLILQKDGRCFKCCKRGHNAKNCKVRINCRKCNGRHASCVCDPNYKPKNVEITSASTSSVNNIEKPENSTSLCSGSVCTRKVTDVYLQTACVFAMNKNKSNKVICRIILDGGSQLSYVTEKFANLLNLPSIGVKYLSVIPFGSSEPVPSRLCNVVRVLLKGLYSNEIFALIAIVVPEICLDVVPVPAQDDFPNLNLADSKINKPNVIAGLSILIGADRYWNFVTGNIKRLESSLTAVESVFGWTIQGSARIADQENNVGYSLCTYTMEELDPQSLWDLELIGIKSEYEEETTTTRHYEENCVKKVNNRYELSLPWKSKETVLHNNMNGAYRRLVSLTRRLVTAPQKLMDYDKAMRDFISAGFAEEVKCFDKNHNRKYYLPHRPVYREESTTTRLRIVFDASAHEGLNPSLNDLLSPGQNLLPDIFRILLNFRRGAIGLVADIEKAFLQLVLNESERDTHRFFWYASPITSIENLPKIVTYRMNRVTFGVTCSPFMLNITLQKHFRCESARYPDTAAVLSQCFYVDDLICSTDDVQAAIKLHEEATKILQNASMTLRKWNSNDKNVRRQFSSPPIVQKVLGLIWHTQTDELKVDIGPVKAVLNDTPTKRTVLQVIARFYDPLGYLGPFLMRLKILFQELWRTKQTWDEPLSKEHLAVWTSCKRDVDHLENWAIPRCVTNVGTRLVRFELHLFADASPKGYGTVAYVRSTEENVSSVSFLCAKHRVAPLHKNSKNLTLPRLELTAALIAARLAAYLKAQASFTFSSIFLWSDSKIALGWIKGPEQKWKQYVAHRVKEIKELSASWNWKYCPGKENPADLLTRGILVRKLMESTLWLTGPEWLSKCADHWPEEKISIDEVTEVLTLSVAVRTALPLVSDTFLPERFSNLQKLFRITTYVLRFVQLRQRKPFTDLPSAEEIQQAEIFWVKREQLRYLETEIMALRERKSLERSSKILTLNPKLDDKGLLRVGSRLEYFEEEDYRFPLLLPRNSHISYLMLLDIHQRTLHSGINTMLTELRRRYWIQGARQLSKRIINKCRACRQLFSKAATQPFAPLPLERMSMTRPFHTTGLDFAGPLFVLNDNGESRKMYILLLTCATVRAVHLELVKDLTTETFLLALRKFVARRGKPYIIYSDNARTFKRAAKELQNFSRNEMISSFLSTNQIRWKFIVERAPWWGGFWERLVRSIKNILKTNILKNTLTVDEMSTLLTEAESWINARPLTYNSDDPSSLSPLTPAHFLIGSSLSNEEGSTPSTSITNNEMRLMWKDRMSRANHLWKRWKEEYLLHLRTLHHTKPTSSSNFKLNDVVLLADHSLPRIAWKLARIEEIFEGRDGKVRACMVKLGDGTTLRRAVQHLCPLELD